MTLFNIFMIFVYKSFLAITNGVSYYITYDIYDVKHYGS